MRKAGAVGLSFALFPKPFMPAPHVLGAVAFALGVCVCVVCRLRSHGSVFRLDHERSLQTTARLLP